MVRETVNEKRVGVKGSPRLPTQKSLKIIFRDKMSFMPTESIVTQMAAKSHKRYLGGMYQGSEKWQGATTVLNYYTLFNTITIIQRLKMFINPRAKTLT